MIPNPPYMDMHTHILPGLDDGSSSMEQTENMLRQAYEEGIRMIIATPHFGIRNPDFRLERAKETLQEVQALADRVTPGLKLLLGNELFYSEGIIDSLQSGEAATLNGSSYALVEFSTRDSYDRIYQCIREFTWNGYIPLIAHIERYRCLEGDLNAVRTLVEQGAVIQVNCRSFLNGTNTQPASQPEKRGLFGRKKKKESGFFLEEKGDWVRQLLAAGLVHFIASDCHDDRTRRPVYRKALVAMEGCCDEQTLLSITQQNILHLLRDEQIV